MKTPLDLTFDELVDAGRAASEQADAAARAQGLVPEGRLPGTATVVTLGAHMCKWPIGDPGSREFSFCGRRASEGVYCARHARLAYGAASDVGQPVGAKRQRTKIIGDKEPKRA